MAPAILIWCFWSLIWENTGGTLHVSNIKKRDKGKKFDINLAVVAIAKNEAAYIREWIEYYRFLGVERIYLYDNESADNLYTTIKSYVDSGFVIYHKFPGTERQLPAYDHALKHYQENTQLMAFVDCDEFLMPTDSNMTLYETINSIYSQNIHAGGVAVNWCVYGSSGKKIKEPGLLMERFQMRADEQSWNNKLVKTVVNPRLVKKYVSPHFPQYKLGAWSIDSKGKRVYAWFINKVDFSKIRCNHFFCKSIEEFQGKRARGLADRTNKYYDMRKFNEYDVNDIHDKSMLIYANQIKKILYGAD